MKRFLFSVTAFLSILWGSLTFSALPLHAQGLDTGLNEVGENIALSSEDPRVIATRIVNATLGALGIIMVSLMVYAGFVWMTAGGDSGKVEQAKNIMKNAIIGAIIILMSWAIARFVIERIFEATTDGGGAVSGSGPGGGGGFGGGGGGLAFQVRSISPIGSVPIRNIEVRFLFTRDIDAARAQTAISILKASDNSPVAGTLTVTGDLATFAPAADCPTDPTRKCFDADTEYIARVSNTLRSSTGQALACGGSARPCEARFTTGNIVDTTGPNVSITSPFNGQSVPQDDAIPVNTRVTDDSGIGSIETLVNASVIGRDAPSASTTLSFDASVLWNTSGLATGTYNITSRGFDIDSNSTVSPAVSVVIRPRHCFNGRQDVDETGVDCGGSCGACSGSSCTSGSSCASGVCTAGVCVEQPIIGGFNPNNGRPGTFVTINGINFGATPGRVTIGGRPAVAPAACVGAGISTWSRTQVIVAVPDSGVSGPIVLTTAGDLSDSSNDDRGPRLDDFEVNTIARPGLCAAQPNHGLPGTSVDLVGAGLGATRGQVIMTGDRDVTTITGWTDTNISFNAPVFAPGNYDTRAQIGSTSTNSVLYTIDERTSAVTPRIDAIDPTPAPIGGYITIQGQGFGDRPNRVIFRDVAGNAEGPADVTFPPACSTNYWRDDSIVVKVPATVRDGLGASVPVRAGQYQVTVIRQSDSVRSNNFNYTVASGAPGPGICALTPAVGPLGTMVTIAGEGFGGTTGNVFFKGSGTTRVDATIEAGAWTAAQVTTTVPTGAQTGAVTLRNAGGQISNAINFQVKNCNEDAGICGRTEICCESGMCSTRGVCPTTTSNALFAWQTSTGRIPINPEVVEECSSRTIASPSPWGRRSGGDQACRNADIMMRFSTKLNPAGIIPVNIIVRKCTGTGSNPCTSTTPVSGALSLAAASPEQDFVRFRPAALLDASSTYEVILRTAITSQVPLNVPMKERAAECGAGNAYCFRFVTRQTVCEVGSVAVTPDPFTAQEVDERVPYLASGRALGDECIHLNLSSAAWNWRTVNDGGGPDSRAIFNPPINQESATATALMETGREPVRVLSEVTAGTRTASGTADLFINFVPPRVLAYGPNCQEACQNAALWVKFNIPINISRLGSRAVVVKKCTNENCRSFTSELDLSTAPLVWSTDPLTPGSRPNTYLRIDPVSAAACMRTSLLEPEQFYRVILARDSFISQSSNLPLANTNDPDGFAWNFRVRPNPDARCTAASVTVAPAEKVETEVGARALFDANPVSSPDRCNANGQPLVADRAFSWSSSDAQVSRILNGGTLSISSQLPQTCSNVCLNTGANGVAGRIASCGNSVLETTNSDFCRRPDGSVCVVGDATCRVYLGPGRFGGACTLLAAGSKGSEECDLGASNGPSSSCSNRCLYNPMRKVTDSPAGTCGNGTVEVGEQCDPARICVGGTNAGNVCTTDTECGAGSACRVVERLGCSDTCQALGSVAGGSTCGNGDIAAGEICDDGNTANGDGCSANCLHEGSDRVTAVCGNGAIEAGETCERVGGAWPANCNQQTCLNQGTNTCAAGAGAAPNCCGNGVQDAGEDTGCDQALGVIAQDCTNRCLKKGSSIAYATPSICGDGVIGAGEQCDAAPGAGSMCGGGPRQLAEITGLREPTPAETDNIMRSNIRAEYDAKTGTGVHGLQCGFRNESDCRAGYGLTTGGCCAARPRVTASNPVNGETNVCRNALIYASFDTLMNEASLTENLILAKRTAGATCPAGTTLVDADQQQPVGLFGWIKHLWTRLVAYVTGKPVYAQVWCAGQVTGEIRAERQRGVGGTEFTTAYFVISRALEANTQYRLLIRGDNNLNDQDKRGAHSSRGVVIDGTSPGGGITIDFTTGNTICGASSVNIKDANLESPFLYKKNPESHEMGATVVSAQGGRLVPIVSIVEYGWNWEPWTSSEERNGILYVASTRIDPTNAFSTSTVENRNSKNGVSNISAGVRIARDEVNLPSTVGRVVEDSKPATVIICERPWPFVDPRYRSTTFFDGDGSPFLTGLMRSGPFNQFSSLYCLDQGTTSTADDLPMLTVNATAIGLNDQLKGVRRQFLMNFSDPSLAGDGIGIRVIDNPLHLSASAWYQSQNFGGNPQTLQVDGYEAVKDGSTLYVSAANADNNPTTGNVSTSIYLISRNPDAKATTTKIYNQLVENLAFNINFSAESRNVCVRAGGSVYAGSDGRPVMCSTDWECVNYSTVADPLRCASAKLKLRRDITRIADFQSMTEKFETGKTQRGDKYPELLTGTFLQTMSNSLWASWDQNLAQVLGSTLPKDPVNRFITCGRCQSGSTLGAPCMTNTDCRQGETCTAQVETLASSPKNGFDPVTCWNAVTRRYMCPRYNGINSSIYQYRAVDRGNRYELATQLEFAQGNRYAPPLLTEVKTCNNTRQLCQTNTDCTITAIGDPSVVLSSGQCVGTGGRWIYGDVCGGREYGIDDVCGNGVRGETELCEVGDILPVSCTTSDGRAGTRTQICNDCRSFVDTPASTCVANALCGNGRIDRNVCAPLTGSNPGYKNGQSCNTPTPGTISTECSDTRDASLASGGVPIQMTCQALSSPETCDDGALNGTYGRCNRTCSSIGAYCGDGFLSAGESCDNGTSSVDPLRPSNGQYCGAGCNLANTCSLDCRGRSPYCGDAIVQTGNEQCDGNTETTNRALCVNTGSLNSSSFRPCTTNTDCPVGELCPSDPAADPATVAALNARYKVCAADTVKLCANTTARTACNTDADCGAGGRCQAYASQKIRTCKQPTEMNSCTWNTWSICQPAEFCGDGRVQTGEECDDGNTNNNDSCTNVCKRNVCGDAILHTGAEECDLGNPPMSGARNGQTCSAEYGTTCSRCSTQCRMEAVSGGFCGNGVRETGEICDGTQGLTDVTCRSLGYDYAAQIKCAHGAFGVWKVAYGCYDVGTPLERCDYRPGTIACSTEFDCEELLAAGANDSYVQYYWAAATADAPSASIPTNMASRCTGPVNDQLTCSGTCGIEGCKRCSETPPTEQQTSISGQVFDAVYSIYPVPNARVTLYSRGLRVTETFTDADGRFTLNGLTNQPACNAYRIVVDFYQDNPCTGPRNQNTATNPPSCAGQRWTQTFDENEGARGGYWPYESKTFSASTFRQTGINDLSGNVYLIPRVGANETLMVHSWRGALLADNSSGLQMESVGSGRVCSEISLDANGLPAPAPPNSYRRFMDAHVLIPQSTGYVDVHYGLPGQNNLTASPNGRLHCFKRCSENTNCGGFESSPQATKVRRNTDFVTDTSGQPAKVSYYIVDYSPNINNPGWQFNQQINTMVRIVTQNDYYELTPPTNNPGCNGKYWHVFDQDVQTGQMNFLSAESKGRYECSAPAGLQSVNWGEP